MLMKMKMTMIEIVVYKLQYKIILIMSVMYSDVDYLVINH